MEMLYYGMAFDCTTCFHLAYDANLSYLPVSLAAANALNLYFVCKGIRPACMWWSDIFPDNFDVTNPLLTELSKEMTIKWRNGYCNVSAYPFIDPSLGPFPDMPATLIYHSDFDIADQACEDPSFLANMVENQLLLGQALGYPCAGEGSDGDARYHYMVQGEWDEEPIPVLQMVCDSERSSEFENTLLDMSISAKELDINIQVFIADNEIEEVFHLDLGTGTLTMMGY